MDRECFRYAFAADVPLEEIETTLLLAILAMESLHGEAQARLEVKHVFDLDRRICMIEAETVIGQELNRLFVGFMTREFGGQAFQVQHHRVPLTREGLPVS